MKATLDELMGGYEAELMAAVAERDRRAATPGTVEHAQEQRAAAERARHAELMEAVDLDADTEEVCDDEDEEGQP